MNPLRHRRLVGSYGGGSLFTPSSIAGLQLFLDASQLTGLSNGDPVATWTDMSGNANDATQATSTAQPTYQTGQINSLPIVRYDGVNDILNTPVFSQFPSKRGTIFFVMKPTFASTYKVCLNTYSSGGPTGFQVFQVVTGTKYKFFDQVTSGNASNYDSTVAFSLQSLNRSGDTTLEFKRNGSLENTFTITNNQPTARVLEVGAWSAGNFFKGDIALVLFYDSSLSSSDMALVENWINTKFAIY